MQRIAEIDLLRTIAIVLMVIYHIAFDLQIDLSQTFWETMRITTVALFLFTSGISTQLSTKPLRRAIIVLCCAVLVSATTFLYDPSTFIYFGILHCIGFGMLIMIPLKRLKEWNICFGLFILLLWSSLRANGAQLQIRPTLDFYPPLPWLGIMLIGAGIGHLLYIRNSIRIIHYPLSIINFPGRHSLLIYLLHQPLILSILALLHSR